MRPSSDVRDRILGSVDEQLRKVGAGSLTIDQVAREVGCAKGLVNYHFKTKSLLLSAAAERLFAERNSRWTEALSSISADEAIRRSWMLITSETSSGFWKAEASLAAITDNLTVQTVNKATDDFAATLGKAVARILSGMHLSPSVSQDELGHLLGAGIYGLGMQLLRGLHPRHVEGAYAALWLAILSLTSQTAS